MGARGGPGEFPVIVRLIFQGVQEVKAQIGQIESTFRSVGQTAARMVTPIKEGQTTLQQFGLSARTADTAIKPLDADLQKLATTSNNVASSTRNAASATQPFVAGLRNAGTAADQASTGLQKINTSAGETATATRTFTSNIRGAAFGLTGLFGAANEAAFMFTSLSEAQDKVNDATAEVSRLQKEGKTGTEEYTRATKDLADAQRGLQFTQRLTIQSAFDVVSFLALISLQADKLKTAITALPAVFRGLAAAITGVNLASSTAVGKLGPLGNVMASNIPKAAGLRGALTGLTSALGLTATAGTSVVGSLGPLGGVMAATGAKVGGLGSAMTGMGSAVAAVAVPLGVAVSALVALGGALVGQQKNVLGIGDAMTSLTNVIHNLAAAVPGLQGFYDSLVQLSSASRAVMVNTLQSIPVLGDWIKGIQGAKTSVTDLSTSTVALNNQQISLRTIIDTVTNSISSGLVNAANTAVGVFNSFKTAVSQLQQGLAALKTTADQVASALSSSILGQVLSGKTGESLDAARQKFGSFFTGGGPQLAFGQDMPVPGQGPTATGTVQTPPDFTQANKAWDDYNLKVQQVLGAVALQWQSHIAQFQSMFVQPLAAQLTIAGQLYLTSYAQQVGAHLGTVAVTWSGHITALQATFVQPLAAQLTIAGQFYLTAYANQVAAHLGVALSALVTHAQAVGGQVNVIGQHLTRLVQGYGLLVQAAQQTASSVAASMSNMSSGVNESVNTMGQSFRRLVQGMSLLISAARQTGSNVASAMSNMASSGSSSVNRLAGAVRSAMTRIVSSMNAAASAARNLQSAINALKSKTITVTTRYVTSGSPGGAKGTARKRAHGGDEVVSSPTLFLAGEAGPEHVRVTPLAGQVHAQNGFQGVVNQPTRFFVGEGNKPEAVSVVPLAGTSQAIATHGGNPSKITTSIRAGRGAKKSVVRTEYQPDGDKIIYYSDGSKKKKHYKRRGYSSWGAAARADFGDMSGKIIPAGEAAAWAGHARTEEDFLQMRARQIERLAALRKKEQDKENKGSTKEKKDKDAVEIDPGTGAVHKGGHANTFGIVASTAMRPAGMGGRMVQAGVGGRFGVGGIWHMAAFGGAGDEFVRKTGFEQLDIKYMYDKEDLNKEGDLTKKAKKRLKKAMKRSDVSKITYKPNGTRIVQYKDGTKKTESWFSAMGSSGGDQTLGSSDYESVNAASGYSGIVRKPTNFRVGEGGKAEMITVQPIKELANSISSTVDKEVTQMVRQVSSSISRGGTDRATLNGQPIVIQLDESVCIDGKTLAKQLRRYTLEGISGFT